MGGWYKHNILHHQRQNPTRPVPRCHLWKIFGGLSKEQRGIGKSAITGEVATPAADLLMVKLMLNSVISTPTIDG